MTGDVKYLAAALAVLGGTVSAFGEAKIVSKALEGMARNPEMHKKLNTGMILGCALTETTGIYGFVVALLTIFIIAMPLINK